MQLDVEGVSLRLTRSAVRIGRLDEPDAVIEASADQLLAVVTGQLPITRLRVRGDRRIAEAALRLT